MGVSMTGGTVAKSMKEELLHRVELCKEKGKSPCLAILRVGARADDLAYERGARKRMEMLGIECRVIELSEQVSQQKLDETFSMLNEEKDVHGILVFQPFPSHLSAENVKKTIHPEKDVDCMCTENLAHVFLGDGLGYGPCTAEAVMEMLDYYEIDVAGKQVVILGRSMVIGKPLAMRMIEKNATVTICHSRTRDLEKVCRRADILVAAVGRAKMVSADMVKEGAVVVDVGINLDPEGKLCGDVDYDSVVRKASFISPVPGGVGNITTSVLAKHVIRAAEK